MGPGPRDRGRRAGDPRRRASPGLQAARRLAREVRRRLLAEGELSRTRAAASSRRDPVLGQVPPSALTVLVAAAALALPGAIVALGRRYRADIPDWDEQQRPASVGQPVAERQLDHVPSLATTPPELPPALAATVCRQRCRQDPGCRRLGPSTTNGSRTTSSSSSPRSTRCSAVAGRGALTLPTTSA